MTEPARRVVILGGGFGGRAVAEELCRGVHPDEAEITLVDQNNFTLFTPMLPEVAGGEVDPQDIMAPLATLMPRVTLLEGRVESIDLSTKQVTVVLGDAANGIPEAHRQLQADHLVIALGSVTNFHDIPGLAGHSRTIKTVEEAGAIRDRALALLRRAAEEREAAKRLHLLTFVIGGGGFSGVETAAALNDLVRDLCPAFPGLNRDDVRMILVQSGDRILPELSDDLAAFAHSKLAGRGVEILLRTDVMAAGDGWIEIRDATGAQRRIETCTIVWAGGVTPAPVIAAAGAPLGPHHGIVTDSCCAASGYAGVWAVGDCAEIPKPQGKGTYAPIAQNATREGLLAARNIAAALHGGIPEPFTYHPLGELAIVGKRSGVASLYGIHLAGFLVWAIWRVIYLAKLPGAEKRIRVAIDWILDLVFGRDLSTLPGRDLRDQEATKGLPGQ